ncbi:MAG: tRNA 2-thiouridine(34) synthase MnmA [Minisyncoccia bacterium]|jgi:tRNA-specific 2-thiouridylase
MKDKKKVFVGMSGGVDSSVATMLLRDEGHEVVGVFMRCYNLDGCAERDAEDARRVAEHLGIPFYVWDFEEEYKRRVVDYMIEGYRAGITPNPDVMCNREIKFGLFLKKALAMGADYVATGHYVRIAERKTAPGISNTTGQKTFSLFAAKDTNKDQSYFLWTLMQAELARCLFPIGDFLKSDVRVMARRAGLPTAEKKDSQGICFLGNISVEDFLKQHIPEKRGALMTTTGLKIGEHSGAEFYTIGERHLNANFKFPKTGGLTQRKPFYVASKDAATNTVTVAEGNENPALYRKELTIANVNFINSSDVSADISARSEVFARVRYRQPLAAATLSALEKGHYQLVFNKPQKFVAPGQSAVFYSSEGEMLGGGVIL